VLKLWKNMPAAIAIVVTPVAGFDVGVSFAVLSHYLFSIMNFAEDSATAQNAPQPQDIARKLTASLLILMAFASLALKL
jgi:hypothetical protein